jgi:hypothetical protein
MTKIQYTIRNIPLAVDQAIRKRSRRSGKSFNQTVVDLLALQTLGTAQTPTDTNFDWLYNRRSLDAPFDAAIENLSRVDEKLWK